MNGPPLKELARELVETGLSSGASLAGIASVEELSRSPSHLVIQKLDAFTGVGTKEAGGIARGTVRWPDDAKSLLVLGLAHPEDQPHLDWWVDGRPGGTEGNRKLMEVADAVALRAEARGVRVAKLAYHIEHGGLFLKDAAVLAGLGCIGKNNLLVTPQYGPRVRLRAVALDADLPPAGPMDFDPCFGCPAPCRNACPQQAFAMAKHDPRHLGQTRLPGREGVYDRHACNVQMDLDVQSHDVAVPEGHGDRARRVRYCRRCELSCPPGSRNDGGTKTLLTRRI